jgi:transposase
VFLASGGGEGETALEEMNRHEEMNRPIVAWIGIDWADQKHDVSVYEIGTGRSERYEVRHTPEALQQWLGQLRSQFRDGDVAVVLEQGRGALLNVLMSCEFLVLYPINPKSLSNYREALYGSGAKSDPVDAELMQEMVRHNPGRFRAWRPDDVLTRSLRLLTEGRRNLVDESTALTNRLTSLLKGYYPQALRWTGTLDTEWACDFLQQWPTLQSLQRSRRQQIVRFYERHPRASVDLEQQLIEFEEARPLTQDAAVLEYSTLMVQALIPQLRALIASIADFDRKIAEVFRKHPDRPIFESFPGAGAALAPRLSAAFGADRDRFDAATEVQQLMGIAPVTEQSGKKRWVHWRFGCPKFMRQSFHEFADHSRRWCPWAKAYYQLQIQRGKEHHAAIRALAYKWIRILFRCWKDGVPYREEVYSKSLIQHQSPLATMILAVGVDRPRAMSTR